MVQLVFMWKAPDWDWGKAVNPDAISIELRLG